MTLFQAFDDFRNLRLLHVRNVIHPLRNNRVSLHQMAIYNLIVYPKPGRNTPGRGFPDVNVLVKFSRFRFNIRDTPFKEICHAIITPRCGMGTSRSQIGHQIALCAGVVLVRFGASRSLYPHVVETAKRIGKDMLGRLDCFDDFRVGLEVPDEIPNKSLAVHDANSSPRRSSTTHLSSPFTQSVPHDPLAPTTLILYHTTPDFQRGFQKFFEKNHCASGDEPRLCAIEGHPTCYLKHVFALLKFHPTAQVAYALRCLP